MPFLPTKLLSGHRGMGKSIVTNTVQLASQPMVHGSMMQSLRQPVTKGGNLVLYLKSNIIGKQYKYDARTGEASLSTAGPLTFLRQVLEHWLRYLRGLLKLK